MTPKNMMIPDKLAQALKRAALLHEMSQNKYIVKALQELLDKEEDQQVKDLVSDHEMEKAIARGEIV